MGFCGKERATPLVPRWNLPQAKRGIESTGIVSTGCEKLVNATQVERIRLQVLLGSSGDATRPRPSTQETREAALTPLHESGRHRRHGRVPSQRS